MPIGWILRILGMVSGVNVKKVFTALAKVWREVLIILLLAIVLYQNFSGTRFLFWAQTIPALKSELAESENNLKICGDGNAKLSSAIDKNNARIDEYKQLTNNLEASIADLNTVLITERKNNDAEVKKILSAPRPKTCKEAINYLRDARKELTW